MSTLAGLDPAQVQEAVTTIELSVEEQERRVQAAIARRAYEIFESRGCAPWHDLEDWRQAEAELVAPLCCGQMSLDGTLWLGADVTGLEAGTLQVWVAPRHVTICGKPSAESRGRTQSEGGSEPREVTSFRSLDLPLEVDPAAARAKISGWAVEICLPKTQVKLLTEGEEAPQLKAA